MKYPGLSAKGFSLIELMIVVVIVGILAAVTIPAYFNYVLRTRQADAYHNLLDLKAAQEMYYAQYNEYAGPYPSLHAVSNTFTKLVSFDLSDTRYFTFSVTTTASRAIGKGHPKLEGNVIKVTPDSDPCIEVDSPLKNKLGLDGC